MKENLRKIGVWIAIPTTSIMFFSAIGLLINLFFKFVMWDISFNLPYFANILRGLMFIGFIIGLIVTHHEERGY